MPSRPVTVRNVYVQGVGVCVGSGPADLRGNNTGLYEKDIAAMWAVRCGG